MDGKTLIYTDSALESIGFVDLKGHPSKWTTRDVSLTGIDADRFSPVGISFAMDEAPDDRRQRLCRADQG